MLRFSALRAVKGSVTGSQNVTNKRDKSCYKCNIKKINYMEHSPP
jgi:hypothetical protein